MNAPDPNIYRSAREKAGWIDRSDRSRIRVAGPDRAKFLHNLTTNDVKHLPVGSGQEAFVTSPQGKTLGYVSLLALEDAILLRTDPGAIATLMPHLQKYGVFDEVELTDRTEATFELHLAGPQAGSLLANAGVVVSELQPLGHVEANLGGRSVRVVREDPTGRPGFSILGEGPDLEATLAALRAAGEGIGLAELDAPTFDALRIEAGTPVYGRDIGPDQLPQEVGRDDRAINFVKGCYLGQETVARLDALGHVNKILRGAILTSAAVPAPNTPIRSGEKEVGTVRSAAFSPGWGRSLVLGYIRVAQASPGTVVTIEVEGAPVDATVAALPMLPPG